MAHPDALPDGLLDLVVVLVGRHQELVERGEIVAVEVLRRRQLALFQGVLRTLADQVGLADLLQRLKIRLDDGEWSARSFSLSESIIN